MEKLRGILLVALGAASYGVLATFVKVAHGEGYHTGEITFSQFFIGFVVLLIMGLFGKKQKEATPAGDKNPQLKMLLAGTSLGLTSTFYYLSVQYLPVSVCIILLMQTVWMGIILEWVLTRQAPEGRKIIAALIVIAGTLLATNIFDTRVAFNVRGLIFGLLSAMSYTVAMYSSNKVALHLPGVKRSMYLVLGGLIAIAIFWNVELIQHFNFSVIWKWGAFLALFGTILPPLLFTKGLPKTGIGLGSIVSSVEIPVSILFAHFILNESVLPIQWAGVALIIMAIAAMNLRFKIRAPDQ
ncbi:Permease of the drug/metabolite transporter (DMT) superfamily [Mucilaginibacter sp. OK268]|uniref:DMT family transporter n=1 Tax=Mucilaginibacter sp. OK268 TaxID=1881048 RepID=UPI000885F156|nr:DMT family transporter [Mucilaginibacter sp. OK268]SDQ00812.1 Permease of the drug/metabolite transporter (DMT) superfamily [Mucilaginibacter sp. OK268]